MCRTSAQSRPRPRVNLLQQERGRQRGARGGWGVRVPGGKQRRQEGTKARLPYWLADELAELDEQAAADAEAAADAAADVVAVAAADAEVDAEADAAAAGEGCGGGEKRDGVSNNRKPGNQLGAGELPKRQVRRSAQ